MALESIWSKGRERLSMGRQQVTGGPDETAEGIAEITGTSEVILGNEVPGPSEVNRPIRSQTSLTFRGIITGKSVNFLDENRIIMDDFYR